MEIEFDPVKDAANVANHGLSLARALELDVLAVVDDSEWFDEPRLRLYGLIDGEGYCLAAVRRGAAMRVISLRRAHEKEMRRHVRKT